MADLKDVRQRLREIKIELAVHERSIQQLKETSEALRKERHGLIEEETRLKAAGE